jgi:hypothetical protein
VKIVPEFLIIARSRLQRRRTGLILGWSVHQGSAIQPPRARWEPQERHAD